MLPEGMEVIHEQTTPPPPNLPFLPPPFVLTTARSSLHNQVNNEQANMLIENSKVLCGCVCALTGGDVCACAD